ncbi:MAG: terminase family protein [Pseudomonadota bacterium]
MPLDASAFIDFLDLIEGDNDLGLKMGRFLQTEIPGAIADPWQTEAFSSDAETVALLVCRQAGKSCVLAARGVREMERGGTTICLAPAERQTREITRKVARYLKTTNLVIERSTLTEIEANNGSRFIAVPASGATIRGYTADLLLVDECAFLPNDDAVISSILPMLKDNGQAFYASTPAGKGNLFAQMFLEPQEAVHRIKVPGTSIPRLKAKVDRLRRTLSATRFRAEVMCEFLADGVSYFDLSVIEQATSQEKAICPIL